MAKITATKEVLTIEDLVIPLQTSEMSLSVECGAPKINGFEYARELLIKRGVNPDEFGNVYGGVCKKGADFMFYKFYKFSNQYQYSDIKVTEEEVQATIPPYIGSIKLNSVMNIEPTADISTDKYYQQLHNIQSRREELLGAIVTKINSLGRENLVSTITGTLNSDGRKISPETIDSVTINFTGDYEVQVEYDKEPFHYEITLWK